MSIEICLVTDSEGLKVNVRNEKDWHTLIHESRLYNADGSSYIVSHFCSPSLVQAVADGRRRELEVKGPTQGVRDE